MDAAADEAEILTLAVLPKLMQNEVPMLVETSSSSKITKQGNPWVFRISPPSWVEAKLFETLPVLAAEAAGLEQLYPEAGEPWQPSDLYLATHPDSVVPALRSAIGARRAVYSVPDEQVTDRLDVTPWLEEKVAAVLAHRSEVERGAVPGLVAALPPESRGAMLATEWYIRRGLGPSTTAETGL